MEDLRRTVAHLDPADMADVFEEAEPDDRDRLFEVLDLETASDVLVEMEPAYADSLVETMTPKQIADLADQMAPDDAADLLAELDESQSARVLAAMEESNDVTELLKYGEDTAGSVMTPEVCAVIGTATARDARMAVAAASELADPVLNIYVVEPATGRLIGAVSLAELFHAPPGRPVQELADRACVYAQAEEDQEEVARKFRKYDLWVMPVVNAAHKLIGRITVDDIMDVMHEEADEDLAHMVGAPDIEEEEASPMTIVRLRLPWLLITMVAGLLNSIVISAMLATTGIVAIATFVPVILAMGGNTGMQSSAIAVRGIALGYKKYGRLLQLILREIRVGFLLGLACGILTGSALWATLTVTGANLQISPGEVGLTVGTAMCTAMVFGSSYGVIVPVCLHRLHIDPAVASGPFVTTSNDLSSALIYFLTCFIMLQ